MHLVFLGTASCYPTVFRGVTSVAVRFESGDVWLFDCGEGTQVQIQKSSVRPSKVTKIFITHLHGDHLFGLPGFLCTLSTMTEREGFILEIYGPRGLARYIREALNLSRSPLSFKYKVIELIPQNSQYPGDLLTQWPVEESDEHYHHPQELPSVFCRVEDDEKPVWNIVDYHAECTVKASRVEHRIPSFGYVLTESDKRGTLDVEYLKKLGVPPGPNYAKLKSGVPITLPDGTVIDPKDCVGPDIIGRKVTILGDTFNSYCMTEIAKNSDVLIHEATLENSMKKKAIANGHSTPEMAAEFSHKILASTLILYHFSQRYKPHGAPTSPQDSCVSVLLQEAKTALEKYPDNKTQVLAAWDLMEYPVPKRS